MEFVGRAELSVIFILAGGVLLAASYRIAHLARRYRGRMENLLQLASRPLDPLEIPGAAWADLEAGGWLRLEWDGVWFGQPVSGSLQAVAPAKRRASGPLCFELASGDEVRLVVRLIHGEAWGENRLFAEHLARVFVLLLETRLHARTEALSAALAERARLSLYLQHDMRNQAQWVLWVADDFAACEDDVALLGAARRLKDNAPLAHERAERLITALGRNPIAESPAPVELGEAAAQAARLAGIEPVIEGRVTGWVEKGLLARALDNLFSNLGAAWRDKPTVAVTMRLSTSGATGKPMAQMEFFSPWPSGMPQLSPERVFEPFASGRPSGLGLGLYQARKSLREAGGDLYATPSPEGLGFRLMLPLPSP